MEYSKEYVESMQLLMLLGMSTANLQKLVHQSNVILNKIKISTKEDFNNEDNKQLIGQLSKINSIIEEAQEFSDRMSARLNELLKNYESVKIKTYQNPRLADRLKQGKIFDMKSDSMQYHISIDSIVERYNSGNPDIINELINQAKDSFGQTSKKIEDSVNIVKNMQYTFSDIGNQKTYLTTEEENAVCGIKPVSQQNNKEAQPKQSVPDEEQAQPGA